MESSTKSWEAAFSLSDSSREQVLRSSRLRHRHSCVDMNRAPPPAISNPILDSNKAKLRRKNPNVLNSSKVVDDDEDTKNGYNDKYIDTEPIPHTNNPKKTRSLASSALTINDCERTYVPSTSTCQLNTELHERNPHPSNSCSENVYTDAIMAASTTQTSVSVSARTSRKRAKIQMEIIDSVFDYEKLPARLEGDFFQCDALELAPKLLGKFLRRDDVVLQITEVEAYRPNDSACHGRFGVTLRTAVMFGPGGHAYVYLCYGLHVMLNIVADVKGVGAAVLIRSCAPIAGLQTIQSRRGILSSKPILLTGPGKIGQALGLTTDWSGHPLYMAGGLELLDGPTPDNILVGPRVGIDYANPEDVTALWRFAFPRTPWISAPRNNLAPRQ